MVVTVCIASGNTIEAPFVPSRLVASDKLAHLAVFGLIATLIYRALPPRQGANARSFIATGVVICFGISDELHQSFTPGRMADVYDLVADALGAILAICAYRWLHPYRKALEWRLLPARRQERNQANRRQP